MLDAGANEYKYLAQAAELDFRLLEVMTLEAQKEDQKLQKYLHSRLLGRALVSFMPNSKNLPLLDVWQCLYQEFFLFLQESQCLTFLQMCSSGFVFSNT